MKDRKAKLLPGGFYHVYNRAIGDEVIFKTIGNYDFFLGSFRKYIDPIASVCAYCLMPNHFHFLIQIRSEDEILRNLKSKNILEKYLAASVREHEDILNRVLSKQFSNFFNSYSQAYNSQYKRKGNLFIRSFNRIRVNDDEYFKELVVYIHLNPIKSGMCFNLNDWKFSSFKVFESRKSNWIAKDITIDFFNDLNNFIFVHKEALTGL